MAGRSGKPSLQMLDGRQMICEHETELSKEIRILAEVEKIWIIFDVDNSGKLDQMEIKDYLKFITAPSLSLSDQ